MTVDQEYEEGGEMPPAIPAATLVIFRSSPDGGPAQLLMVERSSEMRFAGGAAVFPGGRIDDADRTLAQSLAAADGEALDELAARIGAIRETLEETGLVIGIVQPVTPDEAQQARACLLEQGALAPVLERMGWSLDTNALLPFSRWRPRHRHMRIFDTRFYLADIGTGAVDLAVDQTENSHLFWISASDAIRLADSGNIRIIFPTRRNLERLAQFSCYAEAELHTSQFPSRMITPRIELREGERWLTIPADAGYPVTGEALDSVARG